MFLSISREFKFESGGFKNYEKPQNWNYGSNKSQDNFPSFKVNHCSPCKIILGSINYQGCHPSSAVCSGESHSKFQFPHI